METTTELFGAPLAHIIQGTNVTAHKILLRKRQETGPQEDDPRLDFMSVARTYWGLVDWGTNVEGTGLLQLLMFVDHASVLTSLSTERFKIAYGVYSGGPHDKYYVSKVLLDEGKLYFSLSGTSGESIERIPAMVFLRDFRPAVRLDTVAGRFAAPAPLPGGVTPLRPRREIGKTESPHNANWADKTEAQLRQMCTDLSAQLEMIATGKADLQREVDRLARENADLHDLATQYEDEIEQLKKDVSALETGLQDATEALRSFRVTQGSLRRALYAKLDEFLGRFVGPQ